MDKSKSALGLEFFQIPVDIQTNLVNLFFSSITTPNQEIQLHMNQWGTFSYILRLDR